MSYTINDKTYNSETDYLKEIGWTDQGGGMFASPENSTITSESIRPATEIPFNTPNDTPVYDVSKLAIPQIETTQPEKSAQTLTEQLQALNTQLTGESAYRGQIEQEQGIPEAIKTKNDLTNQLNFLSTEAQQIPLTIQNESIGRGRTVGGVAPLQTAQLRENAIKALGVSALLNAANNNLTTSQTLVDRLVSQKYDPIKEEIDAKTKNLQLIIQSPDYTTAEKNRASQMQAVLDAQKNEIAAQEQNSKDIWGVAQGAASNITNFIPTKQYPTSGLALQAISNAKTPQEALTIATETGLTNSAEPEQGFTLSPGQSRYDANGNLIASVAEKGGGVGSGVVGEISDITQSIINNPSLYDDITPTKRAEVIKELQANGYDTSNLGVKGLSDTAIKEISQTQKALDDLATLKTTIADNLQYVGPITGLQKYNPYSKARKVQADIDRVKQTVGKALEGGVLRKEDEEKYKKILATITDTPDTATYKIDALVSSIMRDIENYKSLQESSGKSLNVKESLQKKGELLTPEAARTKFKY